MGKPMASATTSMVPSSSSSRQAITPGMDLGLLESLRELVRHRDLLYMLTWREMKIRYKQSVMGFLWALLMPMVIISAGIIVRYAFAGLSGATVKSSDIAAVAVKAAPYAFFVAAIRFGTNSLISNSNLLTKVYMPRLIFPMSAVFAQLLDFLVAGTVVGVFLLVIGVGVSVQLLWLPVLLAGLMLLAAGFAIILSAAGVFFRDVKYLVEVLLTFAVFFVPVFYDSKMLGRWGPLILLNPVSPILEAISTTVVGHQAPDLAWLAYSLCFGILLMGGSLLAFRKLEPYFAESV
jgi:lipopolysaccharide transport system permease protein